jgi:hypothetical protein
MSVLSDWECKLCYLQYEAWSDSSSCYYCGGTGERRYSKLVTHEWGGPRYSPSLMQTFGSRSERDQYLRAHGLEQSPTADKHGGAHLGGTASYREHRAYFDPRAVSSRDKGTGRRLDEGR